MSIRSFISQLVAPPFKNYRQRLLLSFPSELHEEVGKALKIIPLQRHEVRLDDGRMYQLDNLIHEKEQLFTLKGEILRVPSRLYFDEPEASDEDVLTATQSTIVNCIYLRHHNGYVRQKYLEKLLDAEEYFVCPFSLQLLGEYVVEILEVLDKHLTPRTMDNYGEIVRANPFYWQQTQSRMVSYWDVYYRHRFSNLKDYVGKRLVDRINESVRERA